MENNAKKLNILVCIKQVPDTTEVHLNDDFTLEREFVAQVMNPADESALERALQLRDQWGGQVTVLTMGPKRAEGTLREALSRGADKAVLLTDSRFAGADTLVTAHCLAKAVDALGGFDLILCGRRAVDGETGQVGPMLASMLDIPCCANVTAIEGNDPLTASQLTEDGVKQWEMKLPALVTFCEWSYRLRLPTLTGLRKARTAEVVKLTPDDLGIDAKECGLKASPTRVIHVSARPVGVRPCRKVSLKEAMDALYDRCPEVMGK